MEIREYENNAKEHTKEQLELLARVVAEVGWRQNVEVNQKGVIIAGHGRYLAWKTHKERYNLPDVWVTDDTGKTIMGQHATFPLTEEQERMWRLADNNLNAMTKANLDLVRPELKLLSAPMMELTGYSADLITEEEDKDNSVPSVSAESPITKLGDLYILGRHRILCGDSTLEADIEKLMGGGRARMTFCDPPCNVDYQGGMGTHEQNKREGIKNDKMTKTQFREFMIKAMTPVVKYTDGGIYVCMSSSELDSLKEGFEKAGGHWQSFIIWVKNNFTLSRADYQNTYEPILYGWRKDVLNHFFIDRRDIANVWEDLREVKSEFDGKFTTITFQGFKVRIEGQAKGEVIRKKQHTDIWRHDKPIKSEEYPTMKPVGLVLEAITNSSKENDIVLDTFLGSGTSLIASEKSNRICYGMELDPKYVDIIVKRWCDYTGNREVIKNGEKIEWNK